MHPLTRRPSLAAAAEAANALADSSLSQNLLTAPSSAEDDRPIAKRSRPTAASDRERAPASEVSAATQPQQSHHARGSWISYTSPTARSLHQDALARRTDSLETTVSDVATAAPSEAGAQRRSSRLLSRRVSLPTDGGSGAAAAAALNGDGACSPGDGVWGSFGSSAGASASAVTAQKAPKSASLSSAYTTTTSTAASAASTPTVTPAKPAIDWHDNAFMSTYDVDMARHYRESEVGGGQAVVGVVLCWERRGARTR